MAILAQAFSSRAEREQMVRAGLWARAAECATLQELRNSYVGEDSRAATYARAVFKEWDKGQDLYLMSIRRQLPINTGLADLWVALYM